MSKYAKKVSVTIKGPLGARKRKKNNKKIIKSIESQRDRIQKATKPTKPNRQYKYAKMPWLIVKLHNEERQTHIPREPKPVNAAEQEKQPQGTKESPRSEAKAYPANHSGHTRVIPFRSKVSKMEKKPEDRA